MDTKFRFENLKIYQYSLDLSKEIFSITKEWPQQYKYNLSDQLLRASLSISLNIAEGSSRTNKDFRHFLSISRGSCYECIPILDIALSEKLVNEIVYQELYNKIYELSKMISSLRIKIN
jgi:four helix bundle protein